MAPQIAAGMGGHLRLSHECAVGGHLRLSHEFTWHAPHSLYTQDLLPGDPAIGAHELEPRGRARYGENLQLGLVQVILGLG